jgi:hypothetical protein
MHRNISQVDGTIDAMCGLGGATTGGVPAFSPKSAVFFNRPPPLDDHSVSPLRSIRSRLRSKGRYGSPLRNRSATPSRSCRGEELKSISGIDYLHRAPVNRFEACPKRFVAPHDLFQAPRSIGTLSVPLIRRPSGML